ncbi:MAG: single-stranded DNA-binding protein, partial [Clostridium baratii]|nr:single-stranded DNA-binding protein [Clostridium baratii]
QSREYQKKISDTEVVKKVAYEVSISKMERSKKEDDAHTEHEEGAV